MSLFRFDEGDGYVYLLSHPVESGFPASASQLMELLEQSSYADFEVVHANIGKLFSAGDDFSNDSLIVAKAIDASIMIKVDESNMMANAQITTACGGKIISLDDAKVALKKAGVIKGVSREALEQCLGQQFEQSPGSVYSAIVAHGQRAKDGTDARFVRLCMTAQDRILTPQEKDGGKVDMRDLGAIITVRPGSPLMKRIPATEGSSGYSVFGNVLEAKPGKNFEIEVLEGTKIDEKDPNLLIAVAKGVPVALPRGIRVDDVLCYNDVDVTTGHIEFDGSVIISGDVKDGMKVKATGDITILGFVESSEIQSDNVITIVQGAIGRKVIEEDDFSCFIRARRNITIGYAQYACIETQQDLLIEKQALHCNLSSSRLIRIGKGDTPRGKLIGGKVLNALRIETGELGAPSGTKTHISIAQSFHELKEKQSEFKKFEKRLAEKAVALNKAKAKASKAPESPKRAAYLNKLLTNEKQLNVHYQRNQRNLKLVDRKLQRLLVGSRVKVNDLMHPGIEVTIARDSKQFTRIYPPHLVKLDEGKITQQFLS
ncbi:DUF342 domain-containing protein [Pseudoalteromonas phenolica]|uniref:DUF342 domain-containing protein n=1 Tax=Pseudoalteromonas phenolica TaxID=161398 RepID=A0A5S3Z0C9_9GAMM|nr:FapA family protein [Pseudoalteromonas phenolica]TMP84183.1 DUF342 domain-containing protein [Pseudoalteromonas phenolica]